MLLMDILFCMSKFRFLIFDPTLAHYYRLKHSRRLKDFYQACLYRE